MNRPERIWTYRLQGSSTLELALILPVCMGIFMGIIYLCFFRYDQAVCKVACYEAVFAAVKKEAVSGESARVREQLKDTVVAMENIQMRVQTSGDGFYAEAEGTMRVPFLPVVFSVAAEAKAEVSHPAEMIRDIRWAQSLAK